MATQLPALSSAAHPALAADPIASIQARSRTAMIAMAALVGGLGVAGALVPVEGAVIASGKVGVESRVKRIAHPVGGTIAAIYVSNGDRVAKGAPLIRLDDAVSGSDAALSSLSVAQLMAQRARLEAEQLGHAGISFPPELTASSDPQAVKAMADERQLFDIRRAEEAGTRAQLAARISQYQQQIAGQRAQASAYAQQAALIQPEREGLQQLYDKGLVTLSRRNQVERQSVDYASGRASLQADMAQAGARITEARQQMIAAAQARRADAGTQLAQVRAALNLQQQRSVAAGDAQSRTLIRAPHAGVVDKLAFSTVGDVVKPAETVLEIVPDGDRRVVEVMVAPADIDRTRIGGNARVRFTASSVGTTPEVSGRVIEVGADRTVDAQSGHSFYIARVAIDRAEIGKLGGLRLVTGMPAEVFIASGSRSLISYLFKPLRDQFQRAFRD